MRLILGLALLGLPLFAQPTVGLVQIYGAYKTSHDKILKASGAREGQPLPKSKGDVEEKIEAVDGILHARIEAYCCSEGKPILYIGIEERGAPSFQYRSIQEQELALPEEIIAVYQEFSSALSRAVAAGDIEEDLSAGHSMMANLPCRVLQERFVGLAELNVDTLRNVMLNAADPDQRAIAAYVFGYAPDKRAISADLLLAVQDPDPSVRANATRSLQAIAVFARDISDQEKKPRVSPTWFVEMLNSIVLSDRLEGARALNFFLDQKPEPALLAHIKERAMPALFEMARWKHLPHALPAFLVLGRVMGYEEVELMRMWVQDRETAISGFQKSLRKK